MWRFFGVVGAVLAWHGVAPVDGASEYWTPAVRPAPEVAVIVSVAKPRGVALGSAGELAYEYIPRGFWGWPNDAGVEWWLDPKEDGQVEAARPERRRNLVACRWAREQPHDDSGIAAPERVVEPVEWEIHETAFDAGGEVLYAGSADRLPVFDEPADTVCYFVEVEHYSEQLGGGQPAEPEQAIADRLDIAGLELGRRARISSAYEPR